MLPVVTVRHQPSTLLMGKEARDEYWNPKLLERCSLHSKLDSFSVPFWRTQERYSEAGQYPKEAFKINQLIRRRNCCAKPSFLLHPTSTPRKIGCGMVKMEKEQ